MVLYSYILAGANDQWSAAYAMQHRELRNKTETSLFLKHWFTYKV